MTRVLAVVAHPDDEILGVGGTLLRHQTQGDEVHIVIVNECRPESHRESFEAEERMGIEYERIYGDGGDLEICVAAFDPDIVYTHSSADLHADHRAVHERVLVATRPQSGVKDIYAFETPSATDWGVRPFVPQMFVDVDATIEDKCHAMEAYASELRENPHPRNIDSLMSRGLFWGQRIGVGYAEAFEVIRECW
jgi:N-acetylglucosamine malate deacetylase 1